MNPKSKEFQKLQKQWYKKLEKTGFKDAEQEDGNLKVWESSYFSSRYSEGAFSAKEDYYRLAGQFLHSHKFETPKEQRIWSLHAEGKSIRTIAKELKTYPQKIHAIIQRLSKEMVNYRE